MSIGPRSWPRPWLRCWVSLTLDYELARWRDKGGVDNAGVVTRRFTPHGFDLVHGNELLAERDPELSGGWRTGTFALKSTRSTPSEAFWLPMSAYR